MAEFEATPIEQMSYAQAAAELEAVVRRLEAGDLELEDSLSYYKRGVELLASLKARLSSAEQQVRILLDETE